MPAKSEDWRDHALEMAWIIIANSNGGNWKDEPVGWKEAACRWRDDYFGHLTIERIKRESRHPFFFKKKHYPKSKSKVVSKNK